MASSPPRAPAKGKPKSDDKSASGKDKWKGKGPWKGKPWRRRGPPRRGRIDLTSVVNEVLEKRVPPEVQRLARVRNFWLELFPASFADHVWPMIVQKHRLIVYVHDSQWLHEMTYWRQDVLSKLEQVWPESGIEALEAYVGQLPPMSERRPPPPPPAPVIDRRPVLDEEVPSETVDALNSIRDPGLRETLARARMMLGLSR